MTGVKENETHLTDCFNQTNSFWTWIKFYLNNKKITQAGGTLFPGAALTVTAAVTERERERERERVVVVVPICAFIDLL